ncbi:MAG: Sec-independent protein translocase protein TatB [Ketobacteraceae bacterium]|nr:Sec-independent protein translocase protein TatB [Ketobacteraceae bacterium]
MFDIGFFELILIAVIALLVLGPERLPHAVRMTGAWISKFRRAATSVREEIEREVNAYEMQQRINEQLEKSGVGEARDVLEKTKQTLRNGILDDETLKEIERRGLGDYTKSLIEADSESDGDDNTEAAKDNKDAQLSSKEIRERNRQQTAIGTAGTNPPPAPPEAPTGKDTSSTRPPETDTDKNTRNT